MQNSSPTAETQDTVRCALCGKDMERWRGKWMFRVLSHAVIVPWCGSYACKYDMRAVIEQASHVQHSGGRTYAAFKILEARGFWNRHGQR